MSSPSAAGTSVVATLDFPPPPSKLLLTDSTTAGPKTNGGGPKKRVMISGDLDPIAVSAPDLLPGHPNIDLYNPDSFEAIANSNSGPASRVYQQFAVERSEKPGCNQPLKKRLTDASPQHSKECVAVLCSEQKLVKIETAQFVEATPKGKPAAVASHSTDSAGFLDCNRYIFDEKKLVDHTFELQQEQQEPATKEDPSSKRTAATSSDSEIVLVGKSVSQKDLESKLKSFRFDEREAMLKLHSQVNRLAQQLLRDDITKAKSPKKSFYFEHSVPSLEEQANSRRNQVYLLVEVDRFKFYLMEEYINSLDAAARQFEPLFCSIMIVDAAKRERLTETFNFDVNTRALMRQFCPPQAGEPSTTTDEEDPLLRDGARRAIFSINQKRICPSLFLILRVHRLFQGDIHKSLQYYNDSVSKMKLLNKDKHTSEQLNAYRQKILGKVTRNHLQPFFWGALHLYRDSQGALELRVSETSRISDFFVMRDNMDDEAIFEELNTTINLEYLNSTHWERGKKRSDKTIPGEINMSVTRLPKLHPRVYYKQQEDLLLVQKNPNSEPFLAREVREIFWNRDLPERKHEKHGKAVEVVTRFIRGKQAKVTDDKTIAHPDKPMFVLPEVSRLYIYPMGLKLRLKNKNVFIRVRVKRDDKNLDSEGEPLFITSGSQSGASVTKADTVTIFKAKEPVFSDEICLELPNELHEHDHVLFTIFQLVSRKGGHSESPIAHGFMKLWPDGHVLWSGRQQVSIYTHNTMLEHQAYGYLQEDTYSDRPDGRLSLFVQVVSPFFAMDEHLSFFFQQVDRYARLPRAAPNSSVAPATGLSSSMLPLRQAVKNVKQIDSTVTVEYSGVLLNHLLRLIRDEPIHGSDQTIRDVAFCSLLNLMHSLDKTCSAAADSSRSSTTGQAVSAVDSYLQFDFDFSDIHGPLVERWISFIDNALLRTSDLRLKSPTRSHKRGDPSPFDADPSATSNSDPEETSSPRDAALNIDETSDVNTPGVDTASESTPHPSENVQKVDGASQSSSVTDGLSPEQRQELEHDFQKQQQQVVTLMFKYSGWLFSLISKSMILHLHERGELTRANSAPRTRFFPPAFCEKLTLLVDRISRAVMLPYSSATRLQRQQTNVLALSMITRDLLLLLNDSLASFLVQAFGVMDRGVVLHLLAQYMHAIMPLPPPTSSSEFPPRSSVQTHQRRHHELQSSGLSSINSINILASILISFMSIIMRSGQYVSLFMPATQMPVPGKVASNIAISNITTLRDSAFNDFFLNSLFADHIVFMLCHKSKVIQCAAEKLLQEMLLRQATDRKYSSPLTTSLVCTAHWGSFVLRWLDKFEVWKEISAESIKIAQGALGICSKQVDDLQNKLYDLEETRRQLQFAATAATSAASASTMSMSSKRGGLKKDMSTITPTLTETSSPGSSSTSSIPNSGTNAQDTADKEFHRLTMELSRWKQSHREHEHRLKLEILNVTKTRRNLLACVVHLLANMDRAVLQSWWKIEAPVIKSAFIEALSMALDAFKFDPHPATSRAELEDFALSPVSMNQSENDATDDSTSENADNTSIDSKIMGFIKRRSTHANSRSTRNKNSSSNMKRGASTSNTSNASSATGKGPTSPGSDFRSNVEDLDSDDELHEIDGTSPENDEKTIILEKNLSAEIGFIILELLTQFVADNDKELKEINTNESTTSARPVLMDKLIDLIASFLDRRLAENVVLHGYVFIERFLKEHRRVVFCKRFDYSERLCSLMLRHCNFVTPSLRKNATLLLYSFILNGYEEIKSFPRLKVLLTLALSDIISDIRDERNLKTSIREILEMATSSGTGGKKTFVDNMRDLCDRLDTLLNDVKKITEYLATGVDNETMADLYERIANVYTYAPDLKAVWLSRLAEHQEKLKNHTEAGQCLLRIVALITEYLAVTGNPREMEGVPVHLLKKCIPSYTSKEIPDEIRYDLQREGGGLSQSGHFSKDGLVRVLERAIANFDKGECWEYCIDVYQLLIPFYHRSYDFRRMTHCYQHLLSCCNSVIEGNTRVFGTFYRVLFFGKALGPELHQHEFVYKFPKITRLSEANEYLQRQIESKVGTGKVKFISTARTIDCATLDCDNFVHIQTTFVKPLAMESEDTIPRPTHFEKNTNFAFFVYETPFTQGKEGMAENEQVEDQYKKKTILCVQLQNGTSTSTASSPKPSSQSAKPTLHQVDHRFPSTKIRLEVTHRQEVILSPIDNAIEQIDEKNQQLRAQLAMDPPRLHMLHMGLTGIVRLQVHAGPKEFARVFLNPDNSPNAYPAERVTLLRAKLRELLDLCDKGIRLSRQLVPPTQMPFQNDLELGYTETTEYFTKYLN